MGGEIKDVLVCMTYLSYEMYAESLSNVVVKVSERKYAIQHADVMINYTENSCLVSFKAFVVQDICIHPLYYKIGLHHACLKER